MNLHQMFSNGMSLDQIARELETSRFLIAKKCRELGLVRDNINKRICDERIRSLAYLSLSDICSLTGLSSRSVRKRLKRMKIKRDLVAIRRKGHDKLRKFFPNLEHFETLDPIGCYYLGLFYADACVYCRNDRPSTFSIGLKTTDVDILEELVSDMQLPLSVIKHRVIKKKIGPYSYENEMSIIKMDSPELISYLCKKGMNPLGEYKQHVPDLPYFWHFVRGLVDGDGSIGVVKDGGMVLQISVKDRCFGDELVERMGVTGIGPYKSKTIWALRCSHKKARQLAAKIWDNPIRCINRKLISYQNALKRVPAHRSLQKVLSCHLVAQQERSLFPII